MKATSKYLNQEQRTKPTLYCNDESMRGHLFVDTMILRNKYQQFRGGVESGQDLLNYTLEYMSTYEIGLKPAMRNYSIMDKWARNEPDSKQGQLELTIEQEIQDLLDKTKGPLTI